MSDSGSSMSSGIDPELMGPSREEVDAAVPVAIDGTFCLCCLRTAVKAYKGTAVPEAARNHETPPAFQEMALPMRISIPNVGPKDFFGKVRAAMNAVDKKLQQSTRIPEFLSESNFEQFRTNNREFLRLEYRESFDTWTPLLRHDYASDARRAILYIMERDWHLFKVEDQTRQYGTDDDMSTDECIPSDLIFERFYVAQI